ncbi:lysoplasmalogenase [Agromyces ramosus]|uniref:lysoplasmalogenase n=1 Tax=Agromyces ramosus TaxID=33879 RepID=UPI0027D8C4A4|nr:lysoplasmalogenase [Agromyces ramosus]
MTAPDSASTGVRGAPTARRTLVAFAPFLALAVVHLAMIALGLDEAARVSKLLLMPALAFAVMLALWPVRSDASWLLITAIAFSWGGDAALTVPGEWWFIIGLGSFLLAHLAYIALFFRLPAEGRRLNAWALGYAVWYIGFLALLAPHLGGMIVPVAVYGAVLGAMAALAAAHGGLIAAGGAFFVVSDSVLALGRFLPGYEFALHDVTVMTSYLAAQGLIALGAVSAIRADRRARVPSRPARDRRASATAR